MGALECAGQPAEAEVGSGGRGRGASGRSVAAPLQVKAKSHRRLAASTAIAGRRGLQQPEAAAAETAAAGTGIDGLGRRKAWCKSKCWLVRAMLLGQQILRGCLARRRTAARCLLHFRPARAQCSRPARRGCRCRHALRSASLLHRVHTSCCISGGAGAGWHGRGCLCFSSPQTGRFNAHIPFYRGLFEATSGCKWLTGSAACRHCHCARTPPPTTWPPSSRASRCPPTSRRSERDWERRGRGARGANAVQCLLMPCSSSEFGQQALAAMRATPGGGRKQGKTAAGGPAAPPFTCRRRRRRFHLPQHVPGQGQQVLEKPD